VLAAGRGAQNVAAARPHKTLHKRFDRRLVVCGGVTDFNKN
jgi:hypothetical protein